MAKHMKKEIVVAAPWSDGWLNLAEVERLCALARAEGMSDESRFCIERDVTFMRNRYVVLDDPTLRGIR